MQLENDAEYKALLSDVIKKQIVILGPDITLMKARNVKGLEVANDGTVVSITGAPQEITQNLIDQFVQLSGLIVKKTMEPLLAYRPSDGPVQPATQQPEPIAQPQQPMSNPIPQPTQAPNSIPMTPPPAMDTTSTNLITPIPVDPPATQSMNQLPTQQPEQNTQPQVDAQTQKLIDDALKQVA